MTVMAFIPNMRSALADALSQRPVQGEPSGTQSFSAALGCYLPQASANADEQSGDSATDQSLLSSDQQMTDETTTPIAMEEIAALLAAAAPVVPPSTTVESVQSIDTPANAAAPATLQSASGQVTIGGVAFAVPTAVAPLAATQATITMPGVQPVTTSFDMPDPAVSDALSRIAGLIETTITGVAADDGSPITEPVAQQLAAIRQALAQAGVAGQNTDLATPALTAASAGAFAAEAVTDGTAAAPGAGQQAQSQIAGTPLSQPAQLQVPAAATRRPGIPMIDKPLSTLLEAKASLADALQSILGTRSTTTAPADAASLVNASIAALAPLDVAARASDSLAISDNGSPAADDILADAAIVSEIPGSATVAAEAVGALNVQSSSAPSAAAPAQGTAPQQPIWESAHHLDLANDSEWLDQLTRDITSTAGNDGQMRFRLNPQTLGTLMVEIRQTDQGATIHLKAETEAARAIIAEAQSKLVAEARAQGLRISDTQVSLSNQPGSQQQHPHRNAQVPVESQIRTAGAAPASTTSTETERVSARHGRYA